LFPFVFGLAACGARADRAAEPAPPSAPSADVDEGQPTQARPYLFDVPASLGSLDAAGAAGVSNEQASAGGAAGAAVDDPTVTEPHIVSVSPENGAVAVAADARIVIEFSQPMDAASTLSAWQSDSLPRDSVAFAWNDAGTVLTVTPQQPLEYAHAALSDAERLELAAKGYAYTLTGAATDRAGHAMAEITVTFSTLREIAHTLHNVPELTGIVVDPQAPALATGFLTVDLAPLPPNIRFLERAVGRTSEYQLFAPVTVSQVAFRRLDASALEAEPRRVVGILPAGTTGDLPLPESLWHFLTADYRARSGARTYSQYRFDLPPGSNAAVAEKLLKDSVLELDYLAP
jgi:hypothetical protein